ncbi:MAG: M48 family metallopeptidase [Micrococcaceae bacterium]
MGEIRVIRSKRRKKTVSAKMVAGVFELRVPANSTEAEIAKWTKEFQARFIKKRTVISDDELLDRALKLREKYLPEVPAPKSIRWVTNQNTRWGSCTITTGSIRVSSKLQDFPNWVVDHVVLHELVHLKIPGHNAKFYEMLNRYPKNEKAEGFLAGHTWAENH